MGHLWPAPRLASLDSRRERGRAASWHCTRSSREQAGTLSSILVRGIRLFCLGAVVGMVLGLAFGVVQYARATERASEQAALLRARLVMLQRPDSAVDLLRLLNSARVRADRPELGLDLRLSAIARARSRDMIRRHYFSHHIPGGGDVFTILRGLHVPYSQAGENLATNNYALFFMPSAVLRLTERDFLRSTEHRRNLLDPGFTRIGIGIADDPSTDRVIVTEILIGT